MATPDTEPTLRIGTRGSPLALWQANEVRRLILESAASDLDDTQVVIEVIKTTGDQVVDRALAEVGGKGLFTKEIDDALLDGRIDIAVHSMKDVPTWLPDGMVLNCLLTREDPRDALFTATAHGPSTIAGLPRGARVGTASLRRQAQLLLLRPDLQVGLLRGNVGTRLRKLEDGAVDATLLAVAGLKRLGEAHRIQTILEPEEMLPAVGQGAIGVASRANDTPTNTLLERICDPQTRTAVTAERACLERLDGSCRTPIAAYATLDATGRVTLDALIAKPDGTDHLRARREGSVSEASAMGTDAGDELARRAGPGYLDA